MVWDSFKERERDRLKTKRASLSGGFWNDGARARLKRRISDLDREESDAQREADNRARDASREESRQRWDKFHDDMDRTFGRGRHRK